MSSSVETFSSTHDASAGVNVSRCQLVFTSPLTYILQAVGWTMWSTVSRSIPSILAALTMAGVGGNVFQTVNKASVAQHAPPELVGTVMGMSGTDVRKRTASNWLESWSRLLVWCRSSFRLFSFVITWGAFEQQREMKLDGIWTNQSGVAPAAVANLVHKFCIEKLCIDVAHHRVELIQVWCMRNRRM